MTGENIVSEILGYLKNRGPTNTFRLAREIGLDRHELLDILERLEEKQAVRFEHGNAIFIKFISKKKLKAKKISIPKVIKKTPVKKVPPVKKKIAKRKKPKTKETKAILASKPKKSKIPFKTWIENLQQLKTPEFIEKEKEVDKDG